MRPTSFLWRQIHKYWLLARLGFLEVSIRWERYTERRKRERVEAATRHRYHRVMAERERSDPRSRAGRRRKRFRAKGR
jgi:hypothetical protein